MCFAVPQTSAQPCIAPVQRCGPRRTTEQSAAVHGTPDLHWKRRQKSPLYIIDQQQHQQHRLAEYNQGRISLPKFYKRCLQAVQRRVGQRQGCHDILQETHKQLAILLLSRDQRLGEEMRITGRKRDRQQDWRSVFGRYVFTWL